MVYYSADDVETEREQAAVRNGLPIEQERNINVALGNMKLELSPELRLHGHATLDSGLEGSGNKGQVRDLEQRLYDSRRVALSVFRSSAHRANRKAALTAVVTSWRTYARADPPAIRHLFRQPESSRRSPSSIDCGVTARRY